MADVTKEVQIRLTAKDAASGIIAQAAGKIQRDVGGMDEKLRSFNKTLMLLRGGGIAAGINMVANTISSLAKEMVTLRDANASASDRMDAFAAHLPILGDMIIAMKSIRELVTGEEEALKKRNEAQKASLDLEGQRYLKIKAINELTGAERPQSKFSVARDQARGLESQSEGIRQEFLERQMKAGKISGSVYAQMLKDEGITGRANERQRLLREIDQAEERERLSGAPAQAMKIAARTMGMFDSGVSDADFRKQQEQAARNQIEQARKAAVGMLRIIAPGGNAIEDEKASIMRQAEAAMSVAGSFFANAVGNNNREKLGVGTKEEAARTAQMREARFLTGVGARNPLLKPTEDTAKNTKATHEGIKLLADAIRAGTAVPFLP